MWADNFAYAEGFDDVKGTYLGLRAATGISPSISPQSFLVKPDVAQQQFDAAAAQAITVTTIELVAVHHLFAPVATCRMVLVTMPQRMASRTV